MVLDLRKQELEDLAISFTVLILVFSRFELRLIPYVTLGIFTAFVFHEVAHRQVARKYGYYAIYRRWDTGIMLALLLGILNKLLGLRFIFAAVGAVQVYSLYAGWEDREIYGKITRWHGNKGVLRVRFKKGLPGQAIGTKVKILV